MQPTFPAPSVNSVPGRVGGYIRTFSNVRMHPLDPHPEEILIEDIAHALSLGCRWAGQCRTHFSVAAHSILVASLCPLPEYRLACLLHDASEAYLPDLPTPVKRLMPEYASAEARLMHVIAAKFGFPWPKGEVVDIYDALALRIEGNVLFTPAGSFGGFPAGYEDFELPDMSPRSTEEKFLERFETYSKL